jgi:serine/threonine protein kinase
LKIGDFGLSSQIGLIDDIDAEGDKYYMAPEVLEGKYGKPADIFSLGLIILELAANIVLPSQGEEWRNLRRGKLDFIPFEVERSPLLLNLLERMLNADYLVRVQMDEIMSIVNKTVSGEER